VKVSITPLRARPISSLPISIETSTPKGEEQILVNSQSAIHLSKNPTFPNRFKHIDLRYD